MKFKFLVTIDVDTTPRELKQLKLTKEEFSDLLLREIDIPSVVPFGTEDDVIFVNGAEFKIYEVWDDLLPDRSSLTNKK